MREDILNEKGEMRDLLRKQRKQARTKESGLLESLNDDGVCVGCVQPVVTVAPAAPAEHESLKGEK